MKVSELSDSLKLGNNQTTEVKIDEVIKRKKGRPRKDVPIQEDKPVEEKKKRGRKKKEVVTPEEIKPKKKRGRKAAVKYFSSSIRKKIPLTKVLQNNNNYILHLNVKEDSLENNMEETFKDSNINENDDTEYKIEQNNNVENIFEQLKLENDKNLSDIQKEYNELLDKEEYILNTIKDDNVNLSHLYEQRIESRLSQDNLIVNKLENYHKDINSSNVDQKTYFTEIQQEVKNDTLNEKRNDDFQNNNRKKGFFEIMGTFIHNKQWLHTTDVCCWWCCHTFDTVPIGNPVKFDVSLEKFQVKGVFCSFSCLVAYRKENEQKYCSTQYLVNYMYKKFTGTFLLESNLSPAPPRSSLKMFGGVLTIEEFRNSFKENKMFKMIDYPMFVYKDYIEEIDIQNVKRVNQNVFAEAQSSFRNLDDKRIEDAKSRLSQIEKATVTIGNTIDKFIKIT